jgi:hypothetical protein
LFVKVKPRRYRINGRKNGWINDLAKIVNPRENYFD